MAANQREQRELSWDSCLFAKFAAEFRFSPTASYWQPFAISHTASASLPSCCLAKSASSDFAVACHQADGRATFLLSCLRNPCWPYVQTPPVFPVSAFPATRPMILIWRQDRSLQLRCRTSVRFLLRQ